MDPGQYYKARAAVKFDLSPIPEGVEITEAIFSLYANSTMGDEYKSCKSFFPQGNGAKSAYRFTTEWKEYSITWNKPWTQYYGGDYNSTRIARNSNSSTKVWEDFDVTSTIDSYINGNVNNYGFLIRFDSYSPAKSVEYISSENSDQEKRPKLTVKYTAPVTVTCANGGEIWKQNTSETITWEDNFTGNAKIEVIENGLLVETIANSVPSNGSYIWNIPADFTPGTNYKIRISSVDNPSVFDESDDVFSIEAATVIIPNAFNIVAAEKYKVTITNIMGREVASFETKDLKQINKMMTSLPSGVHIVNVSTPDQKVIKKMRFVR